MKNYLVTDEQFQTLKERYNNYNVDKHADVRIRELVKVMGDVEGFVPVWSCSGHTKEENIQRFPEEPKKHVSGSKGHIIFAVSEEGETSLNKLLSNYLHDDHYPEVWKVLRPSINFLHLRWPMKIQGIRPGILYPVVELEFRGGNLIKHHPTQMKYFEHISKVLN